jgi:Fe-S-cluster containining protein
MAPNPRRQRARLREMWERIPDIPDCKGMCSDSCGPIDMSLVERAMLRERGVEVPPLAETLGTGAMCPALTPMGRCSVYDDRPTVCRLWGAVAALRCPYGCTPAGGWLSDAESFELLRLSMEIGGAPPGRQMVHAVELERALADPKLAAVAAAIARGRLPAP